MKFKLNIANKEVLLTATQLDVIIELVHGVDMLNSEYVGSGKGDNGTGYAKMVRQLDTSEINISPLADDYVDALRLKTKLHDENK